MIIQAAFEKCWNDTFCHDYHLFRANVLSIISRHKATSSAYFFPCVHISVLWIIPIIFLKLFLRKQERKKSWKKYWAETRSCFIPFMYPIKRRHYLIVILSYSNFSRIMTFSLSSCWLLGGIQVCENLAFSLEFAKLAFALAAPIIIGPAALNSIFGY